MDIYEGKVMVSESLMTGIADSIRRKTGTSDYIQTPSMPGMIDSIVTEPTLQEKSVSLDGSDDTNMDILPDEGYDGLSKVTIAVTGGGPMVDGGFVVNFYNAESQLIQTNSAVCGMFIDSPVSYECDGWKDTDELTVELPITSDEAEAVIDLYPIFLTYEEYSVVFADYPITGNGNQYVNDATAEFKTAGSNAATGVTQDHDFYQVYVKDDENNGDNTAVYVATIEGLPTKKCNRVRIKCWYRGILDYICINNDESTKVTDLLAETDDQYATFNITGDTVSLHFQVADNSGGWTPSVLIIHEIYFYHENE